MELLQGSPTRRGYPAPLRVPNAGHIRGVLTTPAPDDRLADERVQGFYASLHAMVGYCLRLLDDSAGATDAYNTAKTHLRHVPEGAYKEMVKGGIDKALEGLASGLPPGVT